MVPAMLAMIAIVALALLIMGMVVVGLQGEGRWRAPELAQGLASAGRHLNGDAAPPLALMTVLDDTRDGARDRRKAPRRRTAVPAAVEPEQGWAAPEIAEAWERHTQAPAVSAWSGAVSAPRVSGWDEPTDIAPEFDTLLGGEGLSSAWADEAANPARTTPPRSRSSMDADPQIPAGGAWASWTPER